MTRKVSLPKIDSRKTEHLLRQLRRMAPHYTREWPAKDDDDPGVALLKAFSFIAEGVINRLNRAPDRNFLAFLDMLGIRLPPATPARAPVRFLLAQGTANSVVIPKGTQVTGEAKTDPPTPLPFETLETFLAIPAKLAELFAVDPEKDRIYKPHKKFLEFEKVEPELPLLEVTALSGATSMFLQLEPPDQVLKGEFLRIDHAAADALAATGCPPPPPLPQSDGAEASVADHFEAAKPAEGSIVTVTDPLPRDYLEGTKVRRVTHFELFEGKNWQEHVLFLGHEKYFAIKSEAQLELEVELVGSVSNLEPLNIVWEFFGDTEQVKEEGWHRFKLDTDGTLGFSRSGTIILRKPAGEIKEKEINGRKSRWIRARLDGPLPATPDRLLPIVESIMFKVRSTGSDLALDYAFHNDTPLTIKPEFFPFGVEPRIFDRFSMASEEVFSKPGARVKLDFELDATDLLAAPAGVVTDDKMRVFAHAAAGRLVEFQLDPRTVSSPVIRKHDTPPDTRIEAGSIPSVVKTRAGERVGVFVKANDKNIYLRFLQGDDEPGWRWIPLAAPTGELKFNPFAVLTDSQWQVFVVADNQLFSKTIHPLKPDEVPANWQPHPGGPQIDSTPFAVDMGNRSVVFVTDVDGKTWKFDAGWTNVTPTLPAEPPNEPDPDPEYLAAKNARPFIVDVTNHLNFRIYLRNTANELVVIDTSDPDNNHNYETPPNTLVDSNPFVLGIGPNRRIYVRAADNRLWSIQDNIAASWTPHLNPAGFNLSSDPFALDLPNIDFTSVFSTSDKNSLLEFRMRADDVIRGPRKLRAGPLDIIKLERTLSGPGPFYLHITGGSGQTSDNDAVRQLVADLTVGRFGVLNAPLAEPANDETEYELFRQLGIETPKTLQSVTSTTLVQLADTDVSSLRIVRGDFLFVSDGSEFYLREIDSADEGDNVELIDPLPDTVSDGADYFILRPIDHRRDETAGARSARLAMLDNNANSDDDFYNNRFLEIASGPGQSPIGRRIVDYDGASRTVEIEEDLPALPNNFPNNTSDFRIRRSSLTQGWFMYRDSGQEELRPELSWEYWNGRGWVALPVTDTTEKFLVKGAVSFTIPPDIQKTEVAGQENFWIRARIVGGDYGRELFSVDKDNKIKIEKDPIRPPLIKNLTITYNLLETKAPDICLTFNNLNYLDQTAANITEDKHFKPYLTLEDTNKALYFGFDRSFEGGAVRLYFDAKELEVDESSKPSLDWKFFSDNTWKPLSAEDKTAAFTKPESVKLTLPPRFQNSQQFGKAQFWLRATLEKGQWTTSPLLRGVFLNTVDALQARTIRNEILGSSIAVKNQKFQFQRVPVLEGEEVRVLEFLTETELEELKQRGKDTVLAITDQRGEILQTWIRWTEVIEFFDSKPDSRHYRLDRHTGEIEFGDGVHGRIPPAGGDNIQAFAYQTGGGVAGNVAAGDIKGLVTAIGGVESVLNPIPAGGGSEAATNEEMLEIGPSQISHRERAVTPQDFELLARAASHEVRKALCLPNRNAGGRNESGWTSVYIVPTSKAAEPVPSLALRREVQRYLSQRADLTLVDQDHIFVGAPRYISVNVQVTVAARSFETVATAERSVRQKLDDFLHPLTGGPDKEGWDFGRDLAASDLYALLEDIDDVDHVESLRMVFGDSVSEEQVEVPADALLASGTHEIEMTVATENR